MQLIREDDRLKLPVDLLRDVDLFASFQQFFEERRFPEATILNVVLILVMQLNRAWANYRCLSEALKAFLSCLPNLEKLK